MPDFPKLYWSLRRFLTRRGGAIARKTGLTLVVMLTVFLAFRIAAPFLISTGLVRSTLETTLSNWTGERAMIGGTPRITFWPSPKIVLDEVVIERPSAAGSKTFLRIEQLSASFSLVKALAGKAAFSEFHALRPQLSVTRSGGGVLDLADDGVLADAISAVRSSGGGQVLDEALDAKVGEITIEDGSFELTDNAAGRTTVLSAVNATIDWPHLADGLRLNLMGRMQGRDITFDMRSRQPLLLLGGFNADASAVFSSQSFSMRFTGTTNLAHYAFMSGDIQAEVSDIPALLAWSGARLPGMKNAKAASLSGRLLSTSDSLRLDSLNLTIDGTHSTGNMDWTVAPGTTPKITGTLAFDRLDIATFLAAFSLDTSNGPAAIASARSMQTDFDLRLSAQEATLAPFTLTEVGASVKVQQGKARFDIGDSDFEGGDLSAQLDLSGKGFAGGGELRIFARDTDLDAIATRAGLSGPIPKGRGSFDLTVTTDKSIWSTGASDISGSVKLTADTGSIRGFDSTAFRKLAATQSFFPLSDAGGGSFDYTSLTLGASFAAGTATIDDAVIAGTSETLLLSGVVPYATSGMALAGTLEETPVSAGVKGTSGTSPVTPPLHFFAGGSWPQPVISTGARRQRTTAE